MNMKAGLWAALQKVRKDERLGVALLRMLFHASLSDREKEAYDHLKEHGVTRGKDLAKALGIADNHAMNVIRALKKIGCVDKVIGGFKANE